MQCTRARVPVGYKLSEVAVIPEQWDSSNVRAIASSTRNAIVGGPFGSNLVFKDYVAHGVPVIRGQNMSGRMVSGEFVFVTPMKAKSLEANLAYPGDIIFTQRGTLGQVSLVPDQPFSAYLVSQSQMKLSVNRKVADPLFLFYLFTSDEQQNRFQGSTIQTGVPHINLGILCEMPVRLPPLSEQIAIAKALSVLDGLLAALEALIAKKRSIKQAAMQQLLTGNTRLPGFSGEWQRKTLGNISTMLPTANNPRRDLSDWGEVGYIHYGDVHSHPYPVLNCASHDLPRIDRGRVGNAVRIQNGDLVMVDASEDLIGVGKSTQVQGVAERAVVAGLHTILCRGKQDEWAPGFMAYLQFIPEFRSSLLRVASGTSVYAISRKQLADVELPLPPPSEQEAIVAVLSDMDAEIAVLELRRQKTRTIKQGMMQHLLTGRIRLVEPEGTAKAAAS